MRKTLLLLIAFFVSSIALGQSGKYEVQGNIENCKDTNVTMTIWGSDGTTGGSMPINNGKFEMKGETTEPLMVRVEFKDKAVYKYVSEGGYIPYKCSSLWFLIYPGAVVKVNGKLSDFADVYPSGDIENEVLAKLTKVIYPIMNECGNIRVKLEVDKSLSSDEIARLEAEHDKKDNVIIAELNKFINNNSSSYAAVWFLEDMLLRKQIKPIDAEPIIAKISDKYRKTAWFRGIEQRIQSVRYVVGAKLPEIVTENTVDGSQFKLSSLRGKYVIIDFWGSWCGPCMSGMNDMRKFRDANASKVEILGIAKDKREVWQNTLKSSNLNWIHLLNGKDNDDFVSKFNVTGYPTKILISPDGTILFRESGESEHFYTKMKELIK